jgi:NTP pyrophosphatase (non-canonical NTP hydrolase)|tara:strand:- start:568 stop:885 length:318 start_codon:yes stop_codon:yes gene_type:complete
MATDMNKLDARQELLIITMEECGELIQACSKLLRRNELFGNSTEIDNLKTEISDVMCMLELMAEWDVISYEEVIDRMRLKRQKLSKWSQLVSPDEFKNNPNAPKL